MIKKTYLESQIKLGSLQYLQNNKVPIEQTINIAFAVDDNYVQHCSAAITSILLNSDNSSLFRFYILSGKLSEKSKKEIISLKKIRDFSIFFYEMNKYDFSHFSLNRKYISETTYYRLLLLDILPEEIDKIIYLDCDIIAETDIKNLWNIDISEYLAGVVEDEGSLTQLTRMSLPIENNYFNAGVLVLNIKQLRKFDLKNKCFNYYEKYKDIITLQDQDILNGVLNGKCKFLQLSWNANGRLYTDNKLEHAYSKEEELFAASNPYIIHFTDIQKPWKYKCTHPLSFEYWKYAKLAGYKYSYFKFLILKIAFYILKQIFSIKNDKKHKILTILGFKIKVTRNPQKMKVIKNNKPTLAMQLYKMDKGGLEEVVLQIANDKNIREKFNVVILAEYSSSGYLADIARKNGIPVYSFFGNKDNIRRLIKKLNIKIVHFHYNIFGIEEYKKLNVKTVYTIHNNYIWFDKNGVEERNKHYKFVDKFIAVSSQVKEFFCQKFGIPEEKVDVIANGIEYFDSDKIEPIPRQDIGLQEDDFVFINVATFNPIKYHFAQAMALSKLSCKYPEMKLVIIGNIGDKEYYEQFKEFIKELNLEDKIKIINYVPKQAVYRYLKMADCFIMTSLAEGFSIAKCEAMLSGKPMILTDVGGARDVINNNDIGILVKHAFRNIQNLHIENISKDNKNKNYHFDNVDDIIKAMESMYLNKDYWAEKAKTGKNKIRDKFNVKRVREEYFKLYEEIL